MSAWIRGVLARSTARHLVGIQVCDSCAEVCGAACRADAECRATYLTLATHAPLR